MYQEKPADILRKAGLKKTKGRITVLEILLASPRPLSQQEISDKLPSGVNFNYVSIYRALEAFLEAGLIHRVETGDRVSRYAMCGCNSRGHCHPHFICNSCGVAECLPGIKLPSLNEIEVKPGYLVEEQELYLRGFCRDCLSAVSSK